MKQNIGILTHHFQFTKTQTYDICTHARYIHTRYAFLKLIKTKFLGLGTIFE